MATRRSRLQFKPNIGPKIGPKPTGPGTKPSSGESATKSVPKQVAVNPRRISVDVAKQAAAKDDPKSPLREILHSPIKSNSLERALSPRKEVISSSVPKKLNISKKSNIPEDNNISKDVTEKSQSVIDVEEIVEIQDSEQIGNDEEDEESGVPVGNLMTVEKSYFTEQNANISNRVSKSPLHGNEEEDIDSLDKESDSQPQEEQENEPRPPKKSHQKPKRQHTVHFSDDGTVDRTKMKMSDLIFYNPNRNFMKAKAPSKKADTKEAEPEKSTLLQPTEEETKVDEPDNEEDSNQEALPVPQVKIGPDGNLILNEESLVIDNKDDDAIDESEREVIDETDSTTTYGSFRKPRKRILWNDYDTDKFYKALSSIGTDFSLMLKIFPYKTRQDLKKKFLKEDRENTARVEAALRNREVFDLAVFENMDKKASEKSKKKEGKNKRTKSKSDSAEKAAKQNLPPNKKRKRNTCTNTNYFDKDEKDDAADDETEENDAVVDMAEHDTNSNTQRNPAVSDTRDGEQDKNSAISSTEVTSSIVPRNDAVTQNLGIDPQNIINTVNIPSSDPNEAPLILVYSTPEDGSSETVIHVFRLQPDMTRADGSIVIDNPNFVTPVVTLGRMPTETENPVEQDESNSQVVVENTQVDTNDQGYSITQETITEGTDVQNVVTVAMETSDKHDASAMNLRLEQESDTAIQNQTSNDQTVIVQDIQNVGNSVMLGTGEPFIPLVAQSSNIRTLENPVSQTVIDLNLVKTDDIS